MTTSSSSPYQQPVPRALLEGDVVNLGRRGGTPWEVVDPGHWSSVGGMMIRLVLLRSRRSGITRWVASRDLRWPDTGQPVDGLPLPPTPTHPDDVTAAPVGALQPAPVRTVTVPAGYLPADVVVALVAGERETVLLVREGAHDADVCAATADLLADYLTGAAAF